MSDRPFRVLGIQQIAIGAPSKERLRALWIDCLGLALTGNYVSERENVDEDIAAMGLGVARCEVDLMQPLDPAKKPAVHEPPLNHVGPVDRRSAARCRVAHRTRRALRPRRHPKGRVRLRHYLHPPEGQRRRADRRRGRADRAGAGAAGGDRGVRGAGGAVSAVRIRLRTAPSRRGRQTLRQSRSSGLTTPRPPRLSTCVYTIVVDTSLCPSSSCTVRMS